MQVISEKFKIWYLYFTLFVTGAVILVVGALSEKMLTEKVEVLII